MTAYISNDSTHPSPRHHIPVTKTAHTSQDSTPQSWEHIPVTTAHTSLDSIHRSQQITPISTVYTGHNSTHQPQKHMPISTAYTGHNSTHQPQKHTPISTAYTGHNSTRQPKKHKPISTGYSCYNSIHCEQELNMTHQKYGARFPPTEPSHLVAYRHNSNRRDVKQWRSQWRRLQYGNLKRLV